MGGIGRHNYPSDITREEFDMIRKELEAARKKTKPRKTDLYEIFRAVRYVVKSGCQWR
jgi:transposase